MNTSLDCNSHFFVKKYVRKKSQTLINKKISIFKKQLNSIMNERRKTSEFLCANNFQCKQNLIQNWRNMGGNETI